MAGTSVASTRMPAWSWNRSRRACWISRAFADTGWTRLMSRCSGGGSMPGAGTARCLRATAWCRVEAPGREKDFRRDGRQRKVGGEHRHLQQHGTRALGVDQHQVVEGSKCWQQMLRSRRRHPAHAAMGVQLAPVVVGRLPGPGPR